VTCLGLSKSGFIGFGLIATPLLAVVVPPVQAAAILLPVMLIQDYFSTWVYRRSWDHSTLAVTIPGAVLGVGLAWLFAAYLSDALLRLAVGLIALALALSQWLRRGPDGARKRPAAFLGLMWGAVSGFTGTLANAGGPPFLAYLLPQQLAKMAFVGTMALFFAAINTMKVVPYFALGQFSTRNLATSVVLFPFALAMNFLGIRLVRITPAEAFYRLVYAMVFFISLALIWQGTAAIFATERILQ
jgi:uncharacterized membrane protein YfcA